MTPLVSHSKQWHWQCSISFLWNFLCVCETWQTNWRERGKMSELNYLLPKLSLVGMSMMYNIDVHTSDFCSQIKNPRIQSPCQMMIGVHNHLLSKVFRFHYHSQQVIGSLGKTTWSQNNSVLSWTYSSFSPGGCFLPFPVDPLDRRHLAYLWRSSEHWLKARRLDELFA